MANTPYNTKAEIEAIIIELKKQFAINVIGTVSPNVLGIPQLNGSDITENGYYFIGQNGDYGTIIGVDLANNFAVLEVRSIDTTAVYSKIDIPLNITFDEVPTPASENAVWSGGVANEEFRLNHFPFADLSLVNSTVLRETSRAVKEAYVTDYDKNYDYLFSVFRRNQNIGGTYYYEARITKVDSGATNSVKIYRFRVSDNSSITSVDENGYQLLVSENNDAFFVVDWKEITDGTGYGQVLQDYLASENVGSLNYNKRIANYISNYSKTEVDGKLNVIDSKTNGVAVLTDVNSYIENAGLTSTGAVNPSISFRSIIDYPITVGKKVAGFGMENGNKYAAFKDSSNNVINPVFTVENGKILTAPIGSVTLDYTIVGGADTAGDNPNFRFYIGNNDEDFEIKEIGDYKITDKNTKEKSISNEARIVVLENGLPQGGGFEDALSYGLLPSNTAVQNSQILNTALNGGYKTLTISYPGTYLLNGTVYIDDNTEIIIGKGVILKKSGNYTCMFLNRGALTRTTNYNITLKGFNLKVNGFDTLPDVTSPIFGLRGQISLFHVENVQALDTRIDDIDITQWGIHVCSFKNLTIDTGYWQGDKDGIHLGRGDKFVITNHYIDCYDDAVALNAHDYPNCNPEVGDITNGYIAHIEDAKKDNTTGFFSRVLMGKWVDWSNGLQVQHGDTVVSNGNVYRVEKLSAGNTQHTTTVAPTHSSGVVVESTAQGDINWVFNRTGEHYTADILDVKYENITTKDERILCSVEVDTGSAFNRSVHPTVPDSDFPKAELIFDTFYAYQTTVNSLIAVESKIRFQIDIYNVKKAFKTIFSAGSTDSSLSAYKSVLRIINSDFRNVVGVVYAYGGNQTLGIVENNTHTTSVPILLSSGSRLITNNSVTNDTNLDNPVTGDRIVLNRVWKIYNGSAWVNVI